MKAWHVLFVALAGWVASGCASPVVGGECQTGFAACSARCVDLDTDPNNCGDCGITCQGATVCMYGTCTLGNDAAVPDGGLPDGSLTDGSTGDGGRDGGVRFDAGDAGDGSTGDGGTGDGGPSCDLGQIACSGACVDPLTDGNHCGDCTTVCAVIDFCAVGTCTPYCDPPLTHCGNSCVDTMSNPDNCGGCGVRCASGICDTGACSAGSVGHVVAIGHDYTTGRSGFNRLAGNAVFLASGAPVRVLTYEGASTAASIAGVNAAIAQVATATGRAWQRTVTTVDMVPLMLAQADVFLIYSQQGATDMELQSLGMQWAMALDTFVRRGGVVVMFDGGGTNMGTWQILDTAGLFLATGRTDIAGSNVQVVAPGDAVALGVPSTYLAQTNSVRFTTTETAVVVQDSTGPVVIHRVVTP